MPNKKNLMFWSLEILIVATLIWVCMKINFVFQPVAAFFPPFFTPLSIQDIYPGNHIRIFVLHATTISEVINEG